MAEREYKQTPDWPSIITPLTGSELAEIWQDGEQRQGPLSVLGGVPSAHAASHKFGGTDVIGTQDKTANSIPITDGSGTLDVFVSDSSTTVKGKVQLATDGESAANKAPQSNDARLSNARTPTAHAGSHLGGTDDLGLGTAAFLDSGVANGVTPLNSSGQVDSAFLPSYVDDVIEVANYAALPVTGETGKIYVTLDDNLTYRWSGSAYVEISKSLALGETSETAYRGDRGKTAYDHSQTTNANPHGTIPSQITGFDDAARAATIPPADTSRLLDVNGDGVPIFPDGAATYFRNKDWTVTTGWTGGAGTTLSIENSSLKVVTTAGNQSNVFTGSATYQNKPVRLIIKSDTVITNITVVTGSSVFTAMNLTPIGGGRYMADIQWSRTGSDNLVIFPNYNSTAAITWYLESINIGGVYVTPIYSKSCCNRLTNYGLMPAQSPFGQALRASGAQYAECDNPFFGTTGTIAIYFKRGAIGSLQMALSNVAGNNSGLSFRFDGTTNNLMLSLRHAAGDSSDVAIASSVTDMTGWHSAICVINGTSNIKTYYEGTLISNMSVSENIAGLNKLKIASYGVLGLYFIGDIIVRIDNRLWSAADVASWHNDPRSFDSQQKAETPVGYSIVTRKSDGRTEVANGTETLDAINKGQLDAACDDFLMQSYTAGSTFSAGQLGYLHTDGKVYLFDANAEASAKGALYISVGAVTANNVGTFQRGGEFTTTGLTVGAIYYGSETAGAITTTPPTTSGAIVRKIGFAQSSTVLFFNPSNDYITVTSISGISQTVTSFSPSVKFGGNEVGVTYAVRTGYMVKTGKQIEYHVYIQLTSKGTSTGQLSISCEAPPASVFSYASASFFASNVSYSGCLQSTLIGGTFYLSQLSEAGAQSDITNTNVSNNSVLRLHGVIVAQ